jgi:glutamate-ammonia-ligase adenylyltransferase
MVEVPEAVRAALREEREPPPAALEFLSRLDDEYFGRVRPADAAEHGRMAAELTSDQRARLRVTPREGDRYELAIVAFDYFAEFAIFCGLLAAHGLDIESGHVHTSAAAPPSVPPRELLELLGLVADGRGDEARERLHRRLVESLERHSGGFAGAVAPVAIEFANEPGAAWTVMRVRGSDTPGFLYALANALAMRGIYVHSVLIESVGREARDRFAIARRDGRRIEDEAEQQTLRLAVALIKQFTHFLPWAPDPALALRDFDQLLDRLMAEGSQGLELFASPEGLRELARLLGSSAFLWEDFLRRQLDHLRPVLADWRSRPRRTREELSRVLRERLAAAGTFEERRAALNELKDEEMLVVDMKHLLDPEFSLDEFSAALTDLADAVLEEAVSLCRARLAPEHGEPRFADGRPDPLAVFALGKYGGREMGYASDLELLFVYGGPGRTERTSVEAGEFYESLVKELTGLLEARAEGIFHLDLRLRPHGGKGPLATPLPLLADYYRPGGGAAAFERQALIKLRAVFGDRALSEDVGRIRDAFVWSDEPWDREDALHLRERQARELVPAGRTNVKYSRGGLIDTEYAVQYLQLLHGRERLDLRTSSTLEALDRLQAAEILPADEATPLRAAYLFWRRVSDALRMVHGSARDLLLPEPGSEELGTLARRLGYTGATWPEASEALLADVERHRRWTLALFERRFVPGA